MPPHLHVVESIRDGRASGLMNPPVVFADEEIETVRGVGMVDNLPVRLSFSCFSSAFALCNAAAEMVFGFQALTSAVHDGVVRHGAERVGEYDPNGIGTGHT